MIFVFGSNEGGHHGKGAALTAKKYYGAIQGQGHGPQGNSYAIPTKQTNFQYSLTIPEITNYVDQFINYATANPDKGFQVTRIGCGLAGFTDAQIAPLFNEAPVANVFFDTAWRGILTTNKEFEYWGSFSG